MDSKTLFRGRTVLVTGAVGTVGRALVTRLLTLGVGELRAFDNNESELFFLAEACSADPVVPVLGDVRDADKVAEACRGVDIVLHAAALKHVPLCERNPLEAVQTNILGVQNVVVAARQAKVARVVYTSSDKAVNPTNVMGASKLMGERLTSAAAVSRDGTLFMSTRFGNVLGSRGSVVPLLREQIRRGGPVTLTHHAMSRFIMTLDEAVDLVLESGALARGGEVFIPKMATIVIADLVRVMIEELAPIFGHTPKSIEIKEIGPRPGEKLYEELMTSEETRRSIELDRHFAVLPALRDLYRDVNYTYPGILSEQVEQPYTSANHPPMGRELLRAYLNHSGLLRAEMAA